MKAYCNIIDSKVMLSKLPKPDFRTLNPVYTDMDIQEMTNEFNDSIIGEVENVDWVKDENTQTLEVFERPIIVFDWDSQKIECFKPNQPCEVEGLTITKLL